MSRVQLRWKNQVCEKEQPLLLLFWLCGPQLWEGTYQIPGSAVWVNPFCNNVVESEVEAVSMQRTAAVDPLGRSVTKSCRKDIWYRVWIKPRSSLQGEVC